MTETRKTFALKLIAFLKREIEEKLIADRLKDYDLRESVSLWADPPGPTQPIVFVEVVLKARDQPLLAVSFERMDEELAEFEMVEAEDVKTSRTAPKNFAGDTIRSNMPSQPLVSRSLLTDADIELRVSDEPHPKLKSLARQLYKHKADPMIDIFVYTLANLEEVVRMYAVEKLEADLTAFKRQLQSDKESAEFCEALLREMEDPSTTPKRRASVEIGSVVRGDEKLLKEAIAFSRKSEERVLRNFLSIKPQNIATLEINQLCAQADDQLTDQIKLACLEAKQAWDHAAPAQSFLDSAVIIKPEGVQATQAWEIVGKRARTEPLSW